MLNLNCIWFTLVLIFYLIREKVMIFNENGKLLGVRKAHLKN